MMWFNDRGYAQNAYVNGVYKQNTSNGGAIKKIQISTNEKKRDSDERVYSSWFVTLAGEARKKDEARPLAKGDKIKITSIKFTNPSVKQEDGSFKSFLNITLMDYELNGDNSTSTQTQAADNFNVDEDLPF